LRNYIQTDILVGNYYYPPSKKLGNTREIIGGLVRYPCPHLKSLIYGKVRVYVVYVEKNEEFFLKITTYSLQVSKRQKMLEMNTPHIIKKSHK